MSFKNELQLKIRELEQKILTQHGEKLELEQQLQKLKLAEFEEELRQESAPQFLRD
jgi:hypothetical protein